MVEVIRDGWRFVIDSDGDILFFSRNKDGWQWERSAPPAFELMAIQVRGVVGLGRGVTTVTMPKGGWPITTAPKDRRILLGYSWLPTWVVGEWDIRLERWVNDNDEDGKYEKDYPATHWAELPDDPGEG